MKPNLKTMRTNEEFEGYFVWDDLTQSWRQTAGTCQVSVPADKRRALRYLRSQFGSCRNLRPRTGPRAGWVWEIKLKTFAELTEDEQVAADRAAARAAARATYYARNAKISGRGAEAEE